MSERNPQRLAGWILGIWFLIHAMLLPSPGAFRAVVMAVLFAGVILRCLRLCSPTWLGWLFPGFAVLIPFWTGCTFTEMPGMIGEWLAAGLLLLRLTPRRGLWVILCAIAVLASLTLDSASEIHPVFIVVDAAFLMLFSEQIHSPEEARRGFRTILMDSLRLIFPVGIVVSAAFWFFPALSAHTNAAFIGFTDGLNPGDFSELRPSRRTAFVATFPGTSPVPSAGDLYWRGQVLEKNEGLRWSRETEAVSTLSPNNRRPTWRYSLQMRPGQQAALLDFPVSLAASGATPALQDFSHGTMAFGMEALMDAESSASAASDPPNPMVAAGDLAVPEKIAADGRMRALQNELFPGGRSGQENLDSLARFLKSSEFVYSLQSGRMPSDDVAGFLCDRRKGFCEHYAAACANLLRMAGVPARVVTGFRGGRWNPWLRTIAVRESDAHAWIEAWDPAARHWIRFDPTAFVAPELSLQIETERNSEQWPWHRFASAIVENIWSKFVQSFGSAAVAAAVLALAAAAGWAILHRRSRTDPVQIALARIEKYAVHRNLGRMAGETPLAWLTRLQNAVGQDTWQLKQLAAAYEQGVYSRAGLDEATCAQLLAATKSLRR